MAKDVGYAKYGCDDAEARFQIERQTCRAK
jgi:hypothetical protein